MSFALGSIVMVLGLVLGVHALTLGGGAIIFLGLYLSN